MHISILCKYKSSTLFQNKTALVFKILNLGPKIRPILLERIHAKENLTIGVGNMDTRYLCPCQGTYIYQSKNHICVTITTVELWGVHTIPIIFRQDDHSKPTIDTLISNQIMNRKIQGYPYKYMHRVNHQRGSTRNKIIQEHEYIKYREIPNRPVWRSSLVKYVCVCVWEGGCGGEY